MMDQIKTMAIYLLAALSLLMGAWGGLNIRTIANLNSEIVQLKSALQAIDLKAKQDEIKYKENADVIKNKDSKYRGAIAYYERMLREAANSPGSGEASENPAGMDETPSQSTITGCPIEAELRCLDDARVRAGMAEFFRLNNFPVE